MKRFYSRIISSLVVCLGFFFVFLGVSEAATTYSPWARITMTGSNTQVYFDVTDDIFNSWTTIPGPSLDTLSKTFSWAFYLSWAWWVDFSSGSYSVALDCGLQLLGSLTLPCTLSWVALGENIGDILFDRRVSFDPTTGWLSGTASTYVGEYNFSGIILPLMPAWFQEGNIHIAHHATTLTLSGTSNYAGPGGWNVIIESTPLPMNITYTIGSPTNLAHAGIYEVDIFDPDGGATTISDFLVTHGVPSTSLATPLNLSTRTQYCTAYPAISPECPDGPTLSPTTLSFTQTPTVVSNGVDQYSFVLKLRDVYGNLVKTGTTRVEYQDKIRTKQVSDAEYLGDNCVMGTCALITGGDLNNSNNGIPVVNKLASLGNIDYTIASIAPTSALDTLSLSGVIYTDTLGLTYNITLPNWRAPLVFTPWYTTSIDPPASMGIGDEIGFTTQFANTTTAPAALGPTAIYDLRIGSNNSNASFTGFTSPSTISCTKYWFEPSNPSPSECSWSPTAYDPVTLSTDALSFSGTYGFTAPPILESVVYKSHIRYTYFVPWLGNVIVIYPSGAGNIGGPPPTAELMKIIGQRDSSLSSSGGIASTSDIWNTLHKSITLLSRNRTTYADVPYLISTGAISVDDTRFNTKRTLIIIGADITITSDIQKRSTPSAIIALSDRDGIGGNIHIAPGVTTISASLFAEKSVHSSGNNQLYILGSLISYNTESDTLCPYYVSPCASAPLYNLANLRKNFITTPWSHSPNLSGKYPTTALVIEYDGRIITDPPPGLEK